MFHFQIKAPKAPYKKWAQTQGSLFMGSSANKWEDKSNFEEKSEWPIIGLHVLEGGVAYTLLPAHLKEL